MAVEIRQFTALVPANTPVAAPVTIPMTFPPRVVDSIEIIVPPGPSGLVGFAILNSGTRVIPYLSDQWIITADEKMAWPLQQFIDSGSWQFLGYNTGTSDHAVYIRFLLSLTGAITAAQTAQIGNVDLSSSAGADIETDTEGAVIL